MASFLERTANASFVAQALVDASSDQRFLRFTAK
jgi:hypothetical protein